MSLKPFFCTSHPNPCSAFKIYLEPKHHMRSTTTTPAHDITSSGSSPICPVLCSSCLFNIVVKGTLLKKQVRSNPFSNPPSPFHSVKSASLQWISRLYAFCTPHPLPITSLSSISSSLGFLSLLHLLFQACFPYCLVAWNVFFPDVFMVSSLM